MVWGLPESFHSHSIFICVERVLHVRCASYSTKVASGIITLRIITSVLDRTVNKGGVLFLSYFLLKGRLKKKITNFENKLVYLSGGYLGETEACGSWGPTQAKKFRWRWVGRENLRQRLSVREPRESLLARPLFPQQISIISCASNQSTFEFKNICFLFSI